MNQCCASVNAVCCLHRDRRVWCKQELFCVGELDRAASNNQTLRTSSPPRCPLFSNVDVPFGRDNTGCGPRPISRIQLIVPFLGGRQQLCLSTIKQNLSQHLSGADNVAVYLRVIAGSYGGVHRNEQTYQCNNRIGCLPLQLLGQPIRIIFCQKRLFWLFVGSMIIWGTEVWVGILPLLSSYIGEGFAQSSWYGRSDCRLLFLIWFDKMLGSQ